MAYIPRSSFIPKEASGAIPMQVRRKRTIHVFGLIATIMLVGSILSSVGVFLYNDYLGSQLETAKARLASESEAENQEKIHEVQVYDNKLKVARNLLDNHIAPSRLFEELENSTKGTIRFHTFDFTYDPGFEALLSLGGDTEELTSVLLQERQLSEDSLFSDFSVGNIAASKQDSASASEADVPSAVESISFGVTGTLNKELLLYDGMAPAPARESEVVESSTFEVDTFETGSTTDSNEAPEEMDSSDIETSANTNI